MLLGTQFSSRTMRNYAEGWRRLRDRASRLSARTLRAYQAPRVGSAQLAIVAAAGDEPAEILLYDEIGYWGVTAKDFMQGLAAAGDGPLTLRINSPGGDVFDGLAIYNALRARKAPVTCVVDGLAASAASFIAMAGASTVMAEQSMLMIHNAWGICMGDRNDMLDMAAVMDKIDSQLGDIYAGKCGKPAADLRTMMDDETWFTSNEAKDAGLCDSILTSPQEARASTPLKSKSAARISVAYDPDGDGDDDAAEAISYIQTALGSLTDAIECLTGAGDDEDSQQNAARNAATESEWVVGAAEDLAIDDKTSWDGPAAAERMLDAAGFNGNSPDPAKAKRGFLVYDHHNPKLKGSYKLPFADVVGGELKAVKGGIDAAASRLPQTDIPDDVKTRARAVLDAYENRSKDAENRAATLNARRLRARLAAAEAA